MYKWIIGSLLFACSLFSIPHKNNNQPAPPHKSPQEIQAELDQAEADFAHALTLFNPWYAGPIVAGSPTMMPPGWINVQPYIYVIDNFAAYDSHNISRHASHPLWQLQEVPIFQTGITDWMDFITAPTITSNFRNGQSFTGLTDTPFQLGFAILKQGVWVPGIKTTIGITTPNGKYENLSAKKEGTDSTGQGSWTSQVTLRFGKVLFWWTRHPMNTRLYLAYNIPSTVRVHGLNAYGGGHGARGKVRPGNNFTADLGLEWSLTQRWALATDIVYHNNARTKFNGYPGTDPKTGKLSSVGSGSSYDFELAPGLEYNWNENLAIIGGVWFTVYGRNTGNFVNYNISVTYTFPVN